MRAPRRHRPFRRAIVLLPEGVDLPTLANRANYVGSPEHKSVPSFAGAPRLRSDASKCDPTLGTVAELTAWLRAALIDGRVGAPWEGDFPRYIWSHIDNQWYEARLVNQELGQYKGYPIRDSEAPQ